MRRSTVPPEMKAAIESEIRRYPLTRTMLEERRTGIPATSLAAGKARVVGATDAAFGKAVDLCSEDLAEMERTSTAIEDVYRISSRESQRVFELYYWGSLRHYEVADEIGVSERTLRRIREEIITLVAYRMGALKPGWIPTHSSKSAAIEG